MLLFGPVAMARLLLLLLISHGFIFVTLLADLEIAVYFLNDLPALSHFLVVKVLFVCWQGLVSLACGVLN